eukprot:1369684-Amorphochlora_amoeboformis.AAC.1
MDEREGEKRREEEGGEKKRASRRRGERKRELRGRHRARSNGRLGGVLHAVNSLTDFGEGACLRERERSSIEKRLKRFFRARKRSVGGDNIYWCVCRSGRSGGKRTVLRLVSWESLRV